MDFNIDSLFTDEETMKPEDMDLNTGEPPVASINLQENAVIGQLALEENSGNSTEPPWPVHQTVPPNSIHEVIKSLLSLGQPMAKQYIISIGTSLFRFWMPIDGSDGWYNNEQSSGSSLRIKSAVDGSSTSAYHLYKIYFHYSN